MHGRYLFHVSLAFLALCCARADSLSAQAQPSVEQIKKQYDDALNQLRAAQDRKNELATENQMLKAKIVDLEAKLAASRKEIDDSAEKTFDLRAQNAAWQHFLRLNPQLQPTWRLFIESSAFAINDSDRLYPGDRQWPFGVD